MDNPFHTPGANENEQDKDKHFQDQKKKVFESFQRKPSTMLMAAVETGILRANICRFVAEWRKEGAIWLIKKGVCHISKHRAGFYTTDPALFRLLLNMNKGGGDHE